MENTPAFKLKTYLSDKFNLAILLLLQLFTVIISNSKLAGEDDLFWYLSAGRYITETGTVPSSDVFGFTTSGIPWIPYEWFWDIIVYNLFTNGGYIFLHIFSTMIILIIINLVIYNMARLKVNILIISFVIPLLLLGTALRLSVKPHLASYLCLSLVATILISYRYFKRGNLKLLFWLPLIFLFWINSHMGVMAGFFLLGLFFLGELHGFIFKRAYTGSNIRQLSAKEIVQLAVFIALSAAVTLFNPHGITTYLYAINTVSLKQLENIYEWMPPFSSPYLLTFQNFIYYVFILGIIPVLLYSFKRKDYLPVIISSGFFIYSLKSLRFTVDFMLVSAVFIAMAVSSLYFKKASSDSDKSAVFNKITMAAVIILLIVMVPGNYLYKLTGHPRSFGYGIDETNFPVKLFDFVRTSKISETGSKPLNTYENGGFFAWNFPDKKGFIGSRTISDSVWNDYTNIINLQPGFENKLAEIGFDYVIWNVPFVNYGTNPALLNYGLLSYLFNDTTGWSLVFWDDRSFLFVKNNTQFKSITENYSYKYITPYNLYFRQNIITEGMKNDTVRVESELKRKMNEDGRGLFTVALNKFIQSLRQ
jgi:hypothetical protein